MGIPLIQPDPNPYHSRCIVCEASIFYDGSFFNWYHYGPSKVHRASPSYIHNDLNINLDAKNCATCGKSVCPTVWSNPCPFCGGILRISTMKSQIEYYHDGLEDFEFDREE